MLKIAIGFGETDLLSNLVVQSSKVLNKKKKLNGSSTYTNPPTVDYGENLKVFGKTSFLLHY